MELLKLLQLAAINIGSCSQATFIAPPAKAMSFESIDPSTGQPIAQIIGTNAEHYEQIIAQAEQSASTWRAVPAPKRGELVRQIGLKLREHQDALGSLVALEMGKSKAEGDGEVQEMIDMADFAVGQSRMLYGLTMHSERPCHRMYEQWHPLGVVGVISAFNFPVAVWAWNAFLAAICGNTVVWKPSSKTPLCAIAVQKICNQVMQQLGYNNVFSLMIPAKRAISEQLLQDTRVPLISFTGSCQAGQSIQHQVHARMGRTLLELGGNNAVIVDDSADLALAIPAIVFGAIGTAGQRCTSTRRLLVHQACLEQVVNGLIHAYSQISIGSPLDKQHLMGPLIDAAAVEQFNLAVASAIKAGAKLLYGGKALPGTGFYVTPTLFMAQNHWPIVQAETFAPILYIIPFESLSEAIALQNAVPQGLSSALFTNRLTAAEQFLAATGSDCGIANINIGTSGAEIGGAFGGEKATGGGREARADAWKNYMRRQTTTINWGHELPLAQGIQFDFSAS